MVQITRIRTLKGVGILADRITSDTGPGFRRYNLIYGFNGSGKSTLSRLFACIQSGKVHTGLPETSTFGFELSVGANLIAPDQLSGLEERVCVFNTDFIERHLRWAEGKANSIFYISAEQAEAAAELHAAQLDLPVKAAALAAAEQSLTDRTQTLATLKRGQAKIIAGKLHLTARKYEAPHLQSDYETLSYDGSSILETEVLDGYEKVVSSLAPLPAAKLIEAPLAGVEKIVENARSHAITTIGDTMVSELKTHAEMVPWVKVGSDYHSKHELKLCLFCGQQLSKERKTALAAAFNDALSQFIAELASAGAQANGTMNRIELATMDANALTLMPELKLKFQAAIASLADAMPAIRALFGEIKKIYDARRIAPTLLVNTSLPSAEYVADKCERVRAAIAELNILVSQHNANVKEFDKHQDAARLCIKRHFLAEGSAEYRATLNAMTDAQTCREQAAIAHEAVKDQIKALRERVRTHGPAASAISKLVKSYLGHGELSIHAAKEGYELHRHGKLVKGPPSEGEKTAIALCYFLSTLEADGRNIKNLIVVIDDPISSLDTRAMNYACALIRTRLRDAGQLFVLTHNQHCMNEFKKEWKSLARPKDEKTGPTAIFLYLDVKIPAGSSSRSASLIEMSKLLREYDSEYHFLCMKVLEFEKAGVEYSEYGYLMPHVMRRVLELFLAFKIPGNSPVKDKIEALAKMHAGLDKTRIVALERLSQVESHSDSMDDFVTHSSMTIEESRDANAALLQLMEMADEYHTKAIRRQCEPA